MSGCWEVLEVLCGGESWQVMTDPIPRAATNYCQLPQSVCSQYPHAARYLQCNRGCPISQMAWRIGDLQIFDLFNTIFEIVSKHNSETVLVVVEDNINYENLLMLSWDILHRTPAWWWKGSNLLHQKFILFMKICKNPLLVIPAHSPSYQYFGFLWKLSVLHRTSAALCEKTGKPVGRGNLQAGAGEPEEFKYAGWRIYTLTQY